jgi:NADH-quinone oxidoreductase subunit H
MNIGWMVVAFAGASAGTIALGLAAKWVDRKVTARLQWRVGPPWYQPAMDCLKLLGKETLVPEAARETGFLAAPILGLAGACTAATLLWVMNLRPASGFVGDAIVVLYLFVIPSLATILGAAASGSPHAGVGAAREMKLLLSYELPLTLALLVSVVHAGGEFRIGELIETQRAGAFALTSVSGLLALLVGIVCIQAKLGLVPFDQAEAETELMAGVYTEYSGPALGTIFLTRAVMLVALPFFLVTLFLGGVGSGVLGVVRFVVALVVVLVLITLIRNTNPRLRIDQSLRFFWYGLTPVAILALVLAGLGRAYGVHWL